jgi:hypothetical protein
MTRPTVPNGVPYLKLIFNVYNFLQQLGYSKEVNKYYNVTTASCAALNSFRAGTELRGKGII